MASSKSTSKSTIFTQLKTHKFVPIGIFTILLIVVGTASALVSRDRTNLSHIQETALPTDLGGVMSIDDIRTLAVQDAANDVTITGVELSLEDGTLTYKVRFSDGSFKLYDAKTGAAYLKLSDDTESSEEVPAGFVAGITVERARVLAQERFTNRIITGIELETEDGVVVYSVKFDDESRVEIRASDGSVLRVRSGAETSTGQGNDTSDDNSNDGNSDDNGNDDNSPNQGDTNDGDSNSNDDSNDSKTEDPEDSADDNQ